MNQLEDVDFLQKCLLLYRQVKNIVDTMVDANWSLTDVARCFDCMPFDEEAGTYTFMYECDVCIACTLGSDEKGKPFLQDNLNITYKNDDGYDTKNFTVTALEGRIEGVASKQGIISHDYAWQMMNEYEPSCIRDVLLDYIKQQEAKLWKK